MSAWPASDRSSTAGRRRAGLIPDLPLVMWIVLATLVIGLVDDMSPDTVIRTFNEGFGRAIGEFALILLPSFAIAAALSRAGAMPAGAGRIAVIASPVAGAAMICPDTAYAALSPAASGRKLGVAFGAYAGFKLLFPAGPLIVATGLGADSSGLALVGIALTIPVWAAGALWTRLVGGEETGAQAPDAAPQGDLATYRIFLPFAVLALLLSIASIVGTTGLGAVDFFLQPKGALLSAAMVAMLQTPRAARRACLDSAVRRTGALLLVIGAASAFGTVLMQVVPLDVVMPRGSKPAAVLGLFALSVVFKLIQGSSMATFAAVTPIAAPLVLASGVDPTYAVFAICLGSFVAILPNDSFYWLVRHDALEKEVWETRAVGVLAGGTIVQALTGLSLLLAAMATVA